MCTEAGCGENCVVVVLECVTLYGCSCCCLHLLYEHQDLQHLIM